MKKLQWGWILFLLGVVILGGKYVSVTYFGPSDDELIRAALDRAITASREGKPGGVLETLSDKFHLNGDFPGEGSIKKFIQNAHPDISVPAKKATISGDVAKIVAPVRAKFEFMGFSMDQTIPDVAMTFQRETGFEWGIIPVKKWRLTQIDVAMDVPDRGL
jgi:hypothetical protein